MNELINNWMSKQMNIWVNEWMNEWMNFYMWISTVIAILPSQTCM